jgi:hypothetical protein
MPTSFDILAPYTELRFAIEHDGQKIYRFEEHRSKRVSCVGCIIRERDAKKQQCSGHGFHSNAISELKSATATLHAALSRAASDLI